MPLPTPLHYAHRSISSLSPGPQQVSFHGIVTNISSYKIDSKSLQAAKGCLKLLLRDENAALLVKVWYDQKLYNDIVLGYKLKISTTHISSLMTMATISSSTATEVPANIMTSIFPEKDAGCSLEVLAYSQCDIVSALAGTTVTSLDHSLGVGYEEKPDPMVMVIVLSVGEVNTITTKSNTTFEVLDLEVADHTSFYTIPNAQVIPSTLSITRPLFSSAATFTPKQTVLLITSPKVLSPSRRKLKLTPRSQIFLNPNTPDAVSLRAWTNRLFPSLPSATTATKSKQAPHVPRREPEKGRKQYTFALFLEEITLRHHQQQYRHHKHRRRLTPRLTLHPKSLKPPTLTFTAYISALITSLPLVHLFDATRLFCGQCHKCEPAIYANTPTAPHVCHTQHLDLDSGSGSDAISPAEVQLQWNDGLLAGFADETGGLLLRHRNEAPHERHNLVLTEAAVHGLTGLRRDDFNPGLELNAAAPSELRARLSEVENRVRWERVTLVLEWTDADLITVLDVLSF